jgi:hypothetical protein
MNTLEQAGIGMLFHVTPLHYIGLIARDAELRSKDRLSHAGMPPNHFRQSTAAVDVGNGLTDVVHLFTEEYPELLHQVLRTGVPHLRLAIPTASLDEDSFLVCRYHIGTDIELQRESEVDGRMREPYRICTAATPAEKRGMLRTYGKDAFEILVPGALPLPAEVVVSAYGLADQTAATTALKRVGVRWHVTLEEPGTVAYRTNSRTRKVHMEFLNQTVLGSAPERERPPIE